MEARSAAAKMTTNVIPQQHLKLEAQLVTLQRTRPKVEARRAAARTMNNEVPQQHWKLKAHLLTRLYTGLKEAPRCAAAKQTIHGVVLLISSTDVRTGGRLHPVEKMRKRIAVSMLMQAHNHS